MDSFKHTENTIDPRDKNLVTYNKDSKKFVCEASSLQAVGIEPKSHIYVIGGHKYIIYMWSEQFNRHILYRHEAKIKSPSGDVIADVFKPYFRIMITNEDHAVHAASEGTELHILND